MLTNYWYDIMAILSSEIGIYIVLISYHIPYCVIVSPFKYTFSLGLLESIRLYVFLR